MKKILLIILFSSLSFAETTPEKVVMCDNLKVMGYSLHSSLDNDKNFQIINSHKYFLEIEHIGEGSNSCSLKVNTGSQIKEYIIKNDCEKEYVDILEIE